jgi:plasmid maintenance system antidote protein VapI
MSDPVTKNISEAVERLGRGDSTLQWIDLFDKQLTDVELSTLVDCLIVHPNIITTVWLGLNRLTDQTGVKLARYIGASSTIEYLSLVENQFSTATYLAVSDALRFNTSLNYLIMRSKQTVNERQIDAAFVDALRLNPNIRSPSCWRLYSNAQNDYHRLKKEAEELGHPTMQSLLVTHLLRSELTT